MEFAKQQQSLYGEILGIHNDWPGVSWALTFHSDIAWPAQARLEGGSACTFS